MNLVKDTAEYDAGETLVSISDDYFDTDAIGDDGMFEGVTNPVVVFLRDEVVPQISGRENMKEAYSPKHNANIYFKTFSEAVQHARETAEWKGFIVDEDDWFNQITTGAGRPDVGQTFTANIGVTFEGKPVNKTLNIQVYGMKGSYELNHYVA